MHPQGLHGLKIGDFALLFQGEGGGEAPLLIHNAPG